MEKFKTRCEENRKMLEENLTKKYKHIVSNEMLADLLLYGKIEKRGYYIVANEVIIECPQEIKLNGQYKIEKI